MRVSEESAEAVVARKFPKGSGAKGRRSQYKVQGKARPDCEKDSGTGGRFNYGGYPTGQERTSSETAGQPNWGVLSGRVDADWRENDVRRSDGAGR